MRCGEPGHAAEALPRLSNPTQASGTYWGLGTETRSRALLSEGEAAETLYRESIERLAQTRVRVDSPEPICCTASGCAANVAGSTRASSYAPPRSYSASSGWRRSPNAPAPSSRRPVSTPVNGRSRRATT